MKAFQAIAKALVTEGVEVFFGLIGGGIEEVARSLADEEKIRFVKVRHEDVAVGMADGYSRATGKIGVALIDGSPGLANASPALLAARMSGSQVLVLLPVSDHPNRHDFSLPNRQSNQSYDREPLLAATVGTWQNVRSVATLSEDVALAFRHVRRGRGPIVLGVSDQHAEMPAGWSYQPKGLSSVATPLVAPRQDDLERLDRLIEHSSRPVVLVGRGAYSAGAREALIALADRSGALIATTLLAKDWFSDYPFSVGLSGGFATDAAAAILQQADLVLAFGASLNDFTLSHGHLYPGAKFAQVDKDPGAFCEYQDVELRVVGDAKLTAQALLIGLQKISRPQWHGPAMAARIAAIDRWHGLDMTEKGQGVNTRLFVDALDKLGPKDRIVCVDIGLFMGVPAPNITVQSPGDIVYPWQLGRMGVGLPVAAGAAIGRPDRYVMAFVGDGGFMAAMNALDTLRSERVPMLLVVMDDRGFGAERRILDLFGEKSTVADYDTPDLIAIATAFGFKAFKVTRGAEIGEILARNDVRHTMTLVHVVMDPSIAAQEMDRAIYKRDEPRHLG